MTLTLPSSSNNYDDSLICPDNTAKTGSERRRFREIAKSYFFGLNPKTLPNNINPMKNNKPGFTVGSPTKKNSLIEKTLYDSSCGSEFSGLINSSFHNLSKTEGYSTTLNHSKINQKSSASLVEKLDIFGLDSEYLNQRKVLILYNIPAKTAVDSILQAVYCGPIEKVVKVVDISNKYLIKYLELHFIKNADAELFFQYAQTGNFLVNGQFLLCQWGNKKINQTSVSEFCKIESLVFPKNEQVYSQHGGSNIRTGARRCLILKKNNLEAKEEFENKNSNYHLYSPNLSSIDLDTIIEDFKLFGDIINITPVISRKSCISINYYDIRSAIQAKTAFEIIDSKINKKYSAEWVVWYGKDVNDKPCIAF